MQICKFGKIDIDDNRDAALQYDIQSIPSIVIFKNGEVVNKFVGISQKKELAAAIDAAM